MEDSGEDILERVRVIAMAADRVWTDGHDHGIVRTYGAFRDNQFVTQPHGVREFVVLTPRRPSTVPRLAGRSPSPRRSGG
jgi:hypothetical protein